MRLIVGLGNPGPEYEWTPHNLGFLAVEGWRSRLGFASRGRKRRRYVGRGELAGEEVILAKPQTMMNLSGVSVRMLLDRYELEPAQMIVLVGRSGFAVGQSAHSRARSAPERTTD